MMFIHIYIVLINKQPIGKKESEWLIELKSGAGHVNQAIYLTDKLEKTLYIFFMWRDFFLSF